MKVGALGTCQPQNTKTSALLVQPASKTTAFLATLIPRLERRLRVISQRVCTDLALSHLNLLQLSPPHLLSPLHPLPPHSLSTSTARAPCGKPGSAAPSVIATRTCCQAPCRSLGALGPWLHHPSVSHAAAMEPARMRCRTASPSSAILMSSSPRGAPLVPPPGSSTPTERSGVQCRGPTSHYTLQFLQPPLQLDTSQDCSRLPCSVPSWPRLPAACPPVPPTTAPTQC
eukprot:1008011-Rhodomonas_salina.2